MEQKINPEQETKSEQKTFQKNILSQANHQDESEETKREKRIKRIRDKKSFLEKSICILVIVSIIVCADGLDCVLGSSWMALLISLAIHSIYMVFFFEDTGTQWKKIIAEIILFGLSCCILYVGLVQAKNMVISYKVQTALSTADERCCNALRGAIDEKIVQREVIVRKYIEDLEEKTGQHWEVDANGELLAQYISLLKNN